MIVLALEDGMLVPLSFELTARCGGQSTTRPGAHGNGLPVFLFLKTSRQPVRGADPQIGIGARRTSW